jgi:hypothetical protein
MATAFEGADVRHRQEVGEECNSAKGAISPEDLG